MSELTLVMNNIKEALEMKKPSAKLILSYLDNFKEEYQHLSDSDFFDIIGETFKLNPEFFMKSLYTKIWDKMGKLYGDEGRRMMERYIIEKFCLYSEEQILYECDGSVEQILSKQYKISVQSGSIFVTNMRIIAQGKFRKATLTSGMGVLSLLAPLEAFLDAITEPSKTKGIKQGLIDSSLQQELPCYGYMFPIKNIFDLRKETKKTFTYKIIHTILTKEYDPKALEVTNMGEYLESLKSKKDRPHILAVQPNIFRYKISSSSIESRENINKLFEILSMKETGRILEGKIFCFKGRFNTFGKDHAGRLVKALGGRRTDFIDKNLSYLVTNSTQTKAKYEKAQERGTKIITEGEFLKMLM
ncbi:MAG: BRCT domain-containing protein [Candidatus Hodarchaeota archaeon]